VLGINQIDNFPQTNFHDGETDFVACPHHLLIRLLTITIIPGESTMFMHKPGIKTGRSV
jgi:hypothetical protein